jgi:hypothetical protein
VPNLSLAHVLNGQQQFFLNGFVVRDLVLGYVNYHHTYVKLGNVLLELQTAVYR